MARSIALLVLLSASVCAGETMPGPQYSADGNLIRPNGYREWMFIGSNLNMGYREGGPEPKVPVFHNIYMQREAYKQYVHTGTFPEKTMVIMEQVRGGTNASINRKGTFEDEFIGIEVALKDGSKSADKWSYFKFFNSDGKILDRAKAFPKEACWNCHNEHGATDNVFTQFYPVLRAARPKP